MSEPEPSRVKVQVDRNDNPFEAMDQPERMRLFIRLLCELVAYGEPEGEAPPARTTRPVRPVPVHRRTRTSA